jgi:hypothetical protein
MRAAWSGKARERGAVRSHLDELEHAANEGDALEDGWLLADEQRVLDHPAEHQHDAGEHYRDHAHHNGVHGRQEHAGLVLAAASRLQGRRRGRRGNGSAFPAISRLEYVRRSGMKPMHGCGAFAFERLLEGQDS